MGRSAIDEDIDNFDWDTEDELGVQNLTVPSSSNIIVPSGSCSIGFAEGESTIDEDIDNFDWNTEDELRIQNLTLRSSSSIIVPRQSCTIGTREASSSASGSNSELLGGHFTGMGFSDKLVIKAIEENGEGNSEAILEALLTYSALENSSLKQDHVDDFDQYSSDGERSFSNDFSDSDSCQENEENTSEISHKKKKLLFLVDMGYAIKEASIAVDIFGPDSSIEELIDFLSAAQMAEAVDATLSPEIKMPNKLFSKCFGNKKRKYLQYKLLEKKKYQISLKEKKRLNKDNEISCLPNPLIGFGVPTTTCAIIHRTLANLATGPPFFYYENVALAPKGVWSTISRFLYDIEPEFVDSKYFCATTRKRGYVHNLPIENRFSVLPLPPKTIHEALPSTRKWWPSWDNRTKLNCIRTTIGSAKLIQRIRNALEGWDEPPKNVQKYVLYECRKYNLVWVGRNNVAPLEPNEVEMLLGFPQNHTRGGGISATNRYKALGNSFQVDTVAYHLSVLKDMFPNGITVLSLFSGIGGAEVALYRLGIPLKAVVSVEISKANRNIVRSWWKQTNQKGTLIDIEDVQQVTGDMLEQFINTFGGFDLVIGGSPCNNLAGCNRVSRNGLEGKQSSLFYDYFRILDLVKFIMGRKK